MNESEIMQTDHPTFEETYPKHEFSELVRLGVLVGTWIGERRRARAGQALPEPIAAADGSPTATA